MNTAVESDAVKSFIALDRIAKFDRVLIKGDKVKKHWQGLIFSFLLVHGFKNLGAACEDAEPGETVKILVLS